MHNDKSKLVSSSMSSNLSSQGSRHRYNSISSDTYIHTDRYMSISTTDQAMCAYVYRHIYIYIYRSSEQKYIMGHPKAPQINTVG